MSKSPSLLPPGFVVSNRYEIEKPLGVGGMGTVYRAVDRNLDKPVAVKLMASAKVKNQDSLRRFEREARAAARIRHDHVYDVTDYGMAEGIPFIVMELLDGEPLLDLLARKKKLPVDQAVDLLLQILDGLNAAHATGIVHRDLKPDNIFLTRQSSGATRVKLIDFGIAKMLDAQGTTTKDGTVMGTPFYMSPEQAGGQIKDIDYRTDIWSASIILYEMLIGQTPFACDTMGKLFAAILLQEPPNVHQLDPKIPEEIGTVILKGLEKNRNDRFSSVTQFAEALRQAATPPKPDVVVGAHIPPAQAFATTAVEYSPLPPELTPQVGVGVQPMSSLGVEPVTQVYQPRVNAPQKNSGKNRTPLIAAVLGLLVIGTCAAVWVGLDTFFSRQDRVRQSAEDLVHTTSQQKAPSVDTKLVHSKGYSENPTTHSDTMPANLPPEIVKIVLLGIPDQAEVFFNQQKVSEKTVVGRDGERGLLEVQAQHYEDFQEEVTLIKGQTIDVSEKLQPMPSKTQGGTAHTNKTIQRTTNNDQKKSRNLIPRIHTKIRHQNKKRGRRLPGSFGDNESR